jgi:hypothetical protein
MFLIQPEGDMRPPIPTILAVSAATASSLTALSMMSVPAQAQYAHCLPARGCVPASQASYNACLERARQLGWTDSDNAPRGGVGRGLDAYIFRCLAAKGRR